MDSGSSSPASTSGPIPNSQLPSKLLRKLKPERQAALKAVVVESETNFNRDGSETRLRSTQGSDTTVRQVPNDDHNDIGCSDGAREAVKVPALKKNYTSILLELLREEEEEGEEDELESPTPCSPYRMAKGHSQLSNPRLADKGGKNEGVDPNRAFKPPIGYALVQNSETDAGEYDWDALTKNKNKELWLIRVPESVKPKYLDGLRLQIPPALVSTRIASLQRKHATFDIWTVGEGSSGQGVVGEEMKSISCLLPRKKKKGKLYSAPIARHLVLSAQPAVPSTDEPSCAITGPFKQPPRENYPPEVLKHQFMPYGSLHPSHEQEQDKMEVDELPPPPLNQMQARKAIKRMSAYVEVSTSPKTEKKKKGKDKEIKGGQVEDVEVVEVEVQGKTKGKKRKGHERTPISTEKKSKKLKTST